MPSCTAKTQASRGRRTSWRVGIAKAVAPAFATALLLALAAAPLHSFGAAAGAQGDLPAYVRASGISGRLSSTGSDTLANLMTLWAEAFKREHPGVRIEVQAPGSSTAPTALIEGTVNFGPMSRRMTVNELQAFERRHGYRPTAVRVALDALTIVVHKDNPLDALSLLQLDALFSATRRCGARRSIDRWGALGSGGSWAQRPVQLYGRNSVSGTYGYFKVAALCGGDFKEAVNEQPGSASVVHAVSASLNGIGYSGIGYLTPAVKALALGSSAGPAVTPSAQTALSGAYPLTRYLYIYLNQAPDAQLPPTNREFLRLILSRQGQEIVAKDGYIPLPLAVFEEERRKLR